MARRPAPGRGDLGEAVPDDPGHLPPHGIDPVTELIPVAPAAHYACGGVRTDLRGRTDVPGLYACGEVACTGVHGANRLASNSLLEGLVFSRRIADVLPGELRPWADPAPDTRPESLVAAEHRHEIQTAMTDVVGVLRTADGMAEAAARLAELVADDDGLLGTRAWETSNVAAISVSLTAAAALREETRGSHWREDFPDRDDAQWAGHVDVRLTGAVLGLDFVPAAATDHEPSPTGSRPA